MAREYTNIADAISAVNDEVSAQTTQIADILEALEGKAGGGEALIQTVTISTTIIDIYWTAFISQYFTLSENKIYHIKNIGTVGNTGWHMMDIVFAYDTASKTATGIIKINGVTKIHPTGFSNSTKVDVNIGDVFELYEVAAIKEV